MDRGWSGAFLLSTLEFFSLRIFGSFGPWLTTFRTRKALCF